MTTAPGRPISPTINASRTRPEANKYAMRNRGTSDWFRHDGKNTEEPPPPHVRLAGAAAEEIAEKHRGDSEDWYQHDHNNPTDAAPVPRLKTEEAKQIQEKIHGSEEKWVKHDENQDYLSPKGKQRLPDHSPSITFKEKFTTQNTMNWYRHDEGPKPRQSDEPPKKTKTSSKKPQPASGTWFSHDTTNEPDVRPQSRTSHNVDAESYLARNRQGTALNWFGHDSSTQEAMGATSPRCTSKEGSDIAKRLGGESENWFDYNANANYNNPRPGQKGSAASQDMIERSRGGEMAKTLMMVPQEKTSPPKPRPESREIAEKSRQGLMDKYLVQNKDYNSPLPQPRIKPEAADAANRNKGAMGDFLTGYPNPPIKKDGPRIKPEAQEIADRNKGSVSKVIAGDPPTARCAGGGEHRSAAQINADRNKGTLSALMGDYGNMSVNDRPHARLQNDAARENAARNQGVANLIM